MRRAMPLADPLSLSNDEVYAISAYVLFLNGIIGVPDRLEAAFEQGRKQPRCARLFEGDPPKALIPELN
jgi:cytochrome c